MPLPVTLISGYLGAGKTTLVNNVLRSAGGRKLMVMVNDFGELPIDADLIETEEGDTITLANGCICCSMNGDLAGAFMDLLDRVPLPDHLLIEASGVAEPDRIANLARAEPDLALHGIVVLADSSNIQERLEDPLIGSTIKKQLASADLLLLNKSDLVDSDEFSDLERALSDAYPRAQLVTCEKARVPVNLLTDLEEDTTGSSADYGYSHEDVYVRWSGEITEPLDKEIILAWMQSPPDGVLRIKGIVSLIDEKTAYILQCVGKRCTLRASLDPAPEKSRLVAIGLKGRTDPNEFEELLSLSSHE